MQDQTLSPLDDECGEPAEFLTQEELEREIAQFVEYSNNLRY